nr:putative disease resistance protein RGA3 [Malus domestica]XP_028943763.1 putative disease resistance protein RGA3 [Malus domestica]XP_028943771.1 putative disease resistance protein RGA3 [Malus domestica]XP_028943779.1 putative disease resistance protein RGA3 [Malus domestica]XP_028943784.1 putative disease resistance protein RGA3 [Malus domestica]XP_028943791.1 putative disease resistance protein RGA3 [Malus domestica]XP_028943797.1 putative disease resistance protein RGA3 [Malus domestic
MLESLDPTKAGLTAREALLKELAEKLKDNRYILIIDDVWNEEMNFWREFMDCLSKLNSGPGSIAIVTTRSANVASIFETMPIIETMPRCDLEGLSEEDCWSVLKGEALPSSLDSDKECIGRAIAKKCAGLPLAAKVLGSLMRSQEWSSILESKIWELRDGDDQIMSILKLSFDNLREPSLKQCFAYCSMFEKDCEIDKDDLVQLWMAQGYLHSSPMEDKGNEHFNILLQNSLFQDARNHEYAHRREREDDHGYTICTMHDLVHDLAEKVFKFESLTRDLDQMDVGALDEIQHVARISSTTLDRFPQRRLRSLFPPRRFEFSNIFQKFRALRTLNLFRVEIEELPSSIGKLKRLRYLNISETEMKELPKSVGKLYNLQTLRMSRMWALKTFPREMENLINLRHVYFDNNVEVPFGMTRLTHLQTLPSFNLDEDRRHRLDELGGLNELKGKLVIGALEYVRDKEEAMKSKLVEKAYLQKLILKWGKERNGNFLDEDILEGLQPHPNLKSLTIEEFKGTKFASWMMRNCQVTNLRQLRIMSCEKLSSLCCGLEYCPSLETVEIKDCSNLESFQISPSQSLQELKIVGCPKLRCTSIHSLPSLRKLVIEKCTSLKESENLQQHQQVEDLSLNGCTSLRKLRIMSCEKFSSLCCGLEYCPSLETVEIEDCSNLESFQISPSQSLQEFKIVGCPKLRCTSIHSLPSLCKLVIKKCTSLEESENLQQQQQVEELSLNGCTSLRDLFIENCNGFTSILSGLHSCTSLRTLSIRHCPNLRTLSGHGLQTPVSLEKMEIWDCPNLKAIPSLDNLTSLTELIIRGCGGLISLSSGLAYCTSLTHLDVSYCCNLEDIPSLDNLTSLTELIIRGCDGLISLSSGLAYCTSLTRLDVSYCCNLEDIPSLDNLTSLTDLIIWECDGFTSILSGLPSCTSLRTLCIRDCRNLRTLSGHGLQTPVSLEKMEIRDCPNLEAIPSLDNLTSLTNLEIRRCDGLISLPSGLAYCTSLTCLCVSECPNLEAIPSLDNLTSLTEFIIYRCDGLISLPSGLAYCTSLTELRVSNCSNLISLADHNVSSLQSLSRLELCNCGKLQYLPKGLHSLSRLEVLSIGAFCQELDSFPDFQVPSKLEELKLKGWPKLKSLPQQIQHSASLTKLEIWDFDGLEALPEWLGNLTSLTKLGIWYCKDLMYLPTVEATQRLTKLHNLVIHGCPRLAERCAKDLFLASGPEWPKIYHIPDLRIR